MAQVGGANSYVDPAPNLGLVIDNRIIVQYGTLQLDVVVGQPKPPAKFQCAVRFIMSLRVKLLLDFCS